MLLEFVILSESEAATKRASSLIHDAGVYKEPDCMWKEGELDHAVTLMGYGTDPQGQDYWLIK